MSTPRPRIEACILAGGLSTRMGRDKSRLRLGERTLLGHARALAAAAGFRTRVIREDAVARCGPLGGIHTALGSSDADILLFLACDMPFVPLTLVHKLIRELCAPTAEGKPSQAAFCCDAGGRFGFPFALRRSVAGEVLSAIRAESWSLQSLAKRLEAKPVRLSPRDEWRRVNLNTPEEFAAARARLTALRRRLGNGWSLWRISVSCRLRGVNRAG